jgi:hypothetical protein
VKSIGPAIAASILTIFAFAPTSLASTTAFVADGAVTARTVTSRDQPIVLAKASRPSSEDETSSTLAPESQKDTNADAVNPDNAGDNASIDPNSANKSAQAQTDDSDKTDPDQTAEDNEKDGEGPDSDDSDPEATTSVNGSSEQSIDTVAQ